MWHGMKFLTAGVLGMFRMGLLLVQQQPYNVAGLSALKSTQPLKVVCTNLFGQSMNSPIAEIPFITVNSSTISFGGQNTSQNHANKTQKESAKGTKRERKHSMGIMPHSTPLLPPVELNKHLLQFMVYLWFQWRFCFVSEDACNEWASHWSPWWTLSFVQAFQSLWWHSTRQFPPAAFFMTFLPFLFHTVEVVNGCILPPIYWSIWSSPDDELWDAS